MAKKKSAAAWPETNSKAEDFMYQAQVLGDIDLRGEWQGWRMRGRFLITPEGEKITPQRLSGICFVEQLRTRTYRAGMQQAKAGKPKPAGPAAAVVQLPRRRVA